MSPRANALLLSLSMLVASGLAVALKPSRIIDERTPPINLEKMVPANFSGWTIDQQAALVQPAPELQEKVKQAYDETLARTYLNANGERVMLSIAYGGDQTGRLRVHRPESCYSAQGFLVEKIGEERLSMPLSTIHVKRLVAQSGRRHEPITYWIRVGDSTVTGLLGQRLTQLRFGLTGEVPDGLIFRVSSIGDNDQDAYALHDRFVTDLMAVLPKDIQTILIGRPADHGSR